MSSDCLFYPGKKHFNQKDIHFLTEEDKEKQQILPFERLEPVDFCHFCLKNDFNDESFQL